MMNNIKQTQRLNERELEEGIAGTSASWHADYKNSAWVYIGGLNYKLSEGDVLCVFSQYVSYPLPMPIVKPYQLQHPHQPPV